MKTISIVIPVYNEEKYIKQIIDKVYRAKTKNFKKQIIVVNDASTDKTKKILFQISKKYGKTLIIINNKTNKGKGFSVRKGILNSSGEIVIIQDSDLEYDPENYANLLAPFIKNNADVVYGSRFISNQPHRILYYWHYLINKFLTTLSNIFTNLNLTDMETGYKVFKGNLLRKLAINLKSNDFGFEPEITAKIAKIEDIKIFEVGISYFGRTYQEGKKINWFDGVKAICQIIKFNLFT